MNGFTRHLCLLLLPCLFIPCFSTSTHTIFYDSIDDTFSGRWVASQPQDYEELWSSKSEGLVVRKYAIAKELDKPIILENGTLVLQFQTLQNRPEPECGSVYLKYLQPQPSPWKPQHFNKNSPYSIMFGAHICGATINVHFTLTQASPHTTQHHLKFPPTVRSDKKTQTFTAIIKPDSNELRILVNGKEMSKAHFLAPEDFEPPLDEKPKFEAVVGIGIEIWTVRYGILVDNILMASEEEVAELYWEIPWRVEAERERLKKIVFDFLYKIADAHSLSKYKHQIIDHIQKLKMQQEHIIGVCIVGLICIAVVIIILSSWKKSPEVTVLNQPRLVPFSGGLLETTVTHRAKEVDSRISSIRSTYNPNLTIPEATVLNQPRLVSFSGGLIETTVTKRAKEVNSWINSIRSTYNANPTVVGLDCEWKPNTVKFQVPNKVAILQLCVGQKCLIMQLFHMDLVPRSIHSFLGDPNFMFVGVEVGRDVKRLSDDYGIVCRIFCDLREMARYTKVYSFCYRYGLANLAKYVLHIELQKEDYELHYGWEARELEERQIRYASIDAYVSYRIGHELVNQLQLDRCQKNLQL